MIDLMLSSNASYPNESETDCYTDLSVSFDKEVTLLEELRRWRCEFGTFIQYHRRAARRAAREVILQQTFRYPLPDSYKSLPTDEQWGDMFSV